MRKIGFIAAAFIVSAMFLSSCSQSDTQQVRRELKTSGEELKKELKSDGRVLKQEAVKAGHEVREEAQKARHDLSTHAKDTDGSSR